MSSTWNFTSQMAEVPGICLFVSLVLILAAVIDGWKLKVPNWITFPMVICGWIASAYLFGWSGFLSSVIGTGIGLALLLPAYAIGGMGAGDVKLMAGVGAWVWGTVTFFSFCVSAIVGGLIAIGMVVASGKFRHHAFQFRAIASEIVTVRNPEKLASEAAERKSTMMLLPYGIPIAIGTIVYFAWMGLLIW